MGKWGATRRGCLALALVAVLGLTGFAPAPDEGSVRKQALALNEITGTAPLKGRLKAMAADELGTRKLLAVASRMAKDKDHPFNRNATLALALAAEHFKDVDAAALFFRLNAKQELALSSENGIAQAYAGLIQMYFDNRKFTEGEKACREFLDLEGEKDGELQALKPVILRRMILAIAKRGMVPQALNLIDKEIDNHPENWLYRIAKAQVLREGDKLKDAAEVYLDVIERVKKDKRIDKEEREEYVEEYRYALSGLYVDMNQIDKAADQLKILLAKAPNNATYNNDLGFIWADKGMNLAEAEKLIRKAIDEDRRIRKKYKVAEDKDNASYIDSLGWVLHKQGKNAEAKKYLLAAVKEKEGQNVEIYDHLAEVHLALGEKKEALAAWKKGLEVAGPSKRDQKRKAEVQRKVRAATKERRKTTTTKATKDE
jgi:predicted Zn-dependent protease